jgi:RsiW-degrading membrane proteinase PrsW (M82 family)
VVVVGVLRAILLPLLFLYIIYALDLYSSGSFRTVATCFAWGLVAFVLALGVNTAAKNLLLENVLGMGLAISYTLTVVLVAPIVEEILKSLVLVYYARRPDFTYFVDGAIYGFAAGIGFSILENFFYMFQTQNAGQGPVIVISRSFSTCLMHGSASALVGVSIGRFRYGHGRTRLLSMLLGWGAAMVLHSAFNRVVHFWSGAPLLLGAVGLGVGGVILIAVFIRWGLAEEKRWINEKLSMEVSVTKGEKALVQELHDLEPLLKPIKERFGKEKTALVEAFLLKQAQVGIKQKSRELATDARLQAQVEAQSADLQAEIDELRRKVGVYCMTYVRSIFPPMDEVVAWVSSLEQRAQAAKLRPAQFDLWSKLDTEAAAKAGSIPGDEAQP